MYRAVLVAANVALLSHIQVWVTTVTFIAFLASSGVTSNLQGYGEDGYLSLHLFTVPNVIKVGDSSSNVFV